MPFLATSPHSIHISAFSTLFFERLYPSPRFWPQSLYMHVFACMGGYALIVPS